MRIARFILVAAVVVLLWAWPQSKAALQGEKIAVGVPEKTAESMPAAPGPLNAGNSAPAVSRVEELRRELAAEPEKSEALLELGIHQINQSGATSESRDLFEKSLQLNPSSGLALTVLVGSYLDLGETERGETFLKNLAKNAPEHSAMHYSALADLRAARGDTRGSAEASAMAVERDPQSAVAHSLLGSALLKENDPRAKDVLLKSGDLFRDDNYGKGSSLSQKQAASALSEAFFREGNVRESERVLEDFGK